MKINRISVFQKDLPLKDPYWLSGGRLKFEVLDATFIKLETDTGITGWGEGTPWGHTYVPAHGPDTEAAHLAQSTPDEFMRACRSCQDMLTIDIAPGSGPRCHEGMITIDDTPGIGVEPDESILGDPLAVYTA